MQRSIRRLLLAAGTAALIVAPSAAPATAAKHRSGWAQTPTAKIAQATAACNGPVVNADRTVTFCLTGPQAGQAVLQLQSLVDKAPTGVPHPMTKDANGVWSVTVGPLEPKWYGYNFAVDGVQLPDPANRYVSFFQAPPIWPGPSSPWSWVMVPGPEANYMAETDVPHGTVSAVYYRSRVLKSRQQMLVYTPPGYHRDKKSFPVLYLYPGGGGANTDWPVNMRANFILDNLIAQGKAKRMIIAMPEYNLRNCVDFTNDVFPQQLLDDVVSTVEGTFRTKSGARNRALAGLSSGAGCTYNTLFQDHREFAYFGVFSPNWPISARDDLTQNHQELLNGRAINKDVKLLYVTRGGDTDTNQVPDHVALLDQYGIDYKYVPGTTYGAVYGHVWDTWGKALNNFAPRLFRR